MHIPLFSHARRFDYQAKTGTQKVPHPHYSKLRRPAFLCEFWATPAVLCDLFHYNQASFL